jgi:hypothetical protein
MPVLAIIIGGVVLLAVLELRNVAPGVAPVAYNPPQPAYPGAAPPTGFQIEPFGGASMVDQLAPTAISDVADEAGKLLQSTSQTLSSAIPVVGGIVAGIASSLLAAHTQRMQDAKSENAAVTNLIPNWQADMVSIARAGQYSRAYRMQQCDQLNQQTIAYLQKQVGKPGTAWSGSPSGCPGSDVPKTENGSHPCNKSCTVGCCIYYNFLEPAVDCLKKRIARGGPGAVAMPTIPGNQYGFPVFPGFTVQIVPSSS